MPDTFKEITFSLTLFWLFASWVIFYAFLSSTDFFLQNSSRNTIWVSNSLDPDQAWLIWPDQGPNFL